MKRGNPPRRRTPLKSGSAIQRKTAAKRTPSSRAKTNRGLAAVQAMVRRRDDGHCVVCGVYVGDGGQVHHRRNRGMGGSRAANTVTNGILVCGTPTSGCHGILTERPWQIEAEEYGWVLPTLGIDDPAAVAVMVAWLGWALPTADGEWQVIDQQAVA